MTCVIDLASFNKSPRTSRRYTVGDGLRRKTVLPAEYVPRMWQAQGVAPGAGPSRVAVPVRQGGVVLW